MDVSGALSRIPQVESNSPVAQSIRCALAEAIIAQELSKHIFQDLYFPGEAARVEVSGLMKALTWLNRTHPHEATIVRCQLAKACAHSTDADGIPAQATESVNTILNCWLNDDTARQQQFVTELMSLFSEAMKIWKDLQRSGKRVEARMEIIDGNWFEEEHGRHEYDSVVAGEQRRSEQTTSGLIGPLAVLFPKILADGRLLFRGYALFPTQAVVMTASQERGSQASSPNMSGSHRRTSEYESGDYRMEQQTAKGGRRHSNASLDGDLVGSGGSYSVRANPQSMRRTADTASMSSRSRRSAN